MKMLIVGTTTGLLGFLLCACSGGQSGTEGESGPHCKIDGTRAVAASEQTVAGTAADVAAAVAGPRRTPLTWYSHAGTASSDTVLTLEVTPDPASARFTERHGVTPADEPSCGPFLALDATLTFVTADGAFADTFRGTVEKTGSESRARFSGSRPLGEHQGTYDASVIAPSYRNPVLDLFNEFDLSITEADRRLGAQDMSGRMFVDGEDPDSDPNTTPVSAAVAEWPSGSAVVDVDGGTPPADGGAR